jgi:hypothetical protein
LRKSRAYVIDTLEVILLIQPDITLGVGCFAYNNFYVR